MRPEFCHAHTSSAIISLSIFNVFVIAGVVGKEVPIDRIFSGIMRFLTIDVLVLVLIMAFPILSLLIPSSM